VPDGNYAFLVERFLAEQARAQNASCPEGAAAHRALADAYRLHLRTLTPILDIGPGRPDGVIMPVPRS